MLWFESFGRMKSQKLLHWAISKWSCYFDRGFHLFCLPQLCPVWMTPNFLAILSLISEIQAIIREIIWHLHTGIKPCYWHKLYKLTLIITWTKIILSLLRYVFSLSRSSASELVLIISPTMYFLMPSHWFRGRTFHRVLITLSSICSA